MKPAHCTTHTSPRPGRRLAALLAAAATVLAGTLAAAPPAAAVGTGGISGTVTGPGGPVADVSVAVAVFDAENEFWDTVGFGTTDETGAYQVTDLDPGAYRVQFNDWTGAHLAECYDDAPSCDEPDLVTVADAVVPDIDAALATPSHITGTVTDGTAPLAGVDVTAYTYDADFDEWSYSTQVSTGPGGTYDLADLAAGTYRVRFVDSSGDHRTEWWNNKASVESADDVVVDPSETVTAIDAVLASAPHLTGTVTGPGGVPLPNVSVSANAYDEDFEFWDEVDLVTTDAAGHYDFGGLPAGTYRLRFRDNTGSHVTEWWNDKTSVSTADDVVIGAETVDDVDAVLAPAATISGTLTGVGGAPITSGSVTVRQYDAEDEFWRSVAFGSTNASGSYTVGGLAAGTYRVEFYGGGAYLTEYYDNKTTVESATDITLASGANRTGVDAQLAVESHITGTVTNPAGAGVGGVGVQAYRWVGGQWQWATFTETETNGTYDLRGLTTGSYRVQFRGSDVGNGTYLDEYYNDAATIDEGTDVVVAESATTANINAVLNLSSHITGTVTNGAGAPVAGATVTALQFDETYGYWSSAASTSTSATGTYDVGGLKPGSYRVRFSRSTYATEYWNNTVRLRGAPDVDLATGASASGINAALEPSSGPPASGSISGTVTGSAGPLTGATATVYRFDTGGQFWVFVSSDATDASGLYQVPGLANGQYRVRFSANGYVPEYFDDAATIAQGTDVAVSGGGERAGVSATLTALSHVTGTVTNAAGSGLPAVEVSAWLDLGNGSWQEVTSTFTGSGGTYDLGLPSGTYRLQFDAPGPYATEWWDDATSRATATDVVVPVSTTVTGRNASLAAASSIAGRVTDAGGAPLQFVDVTAYLPDGFGGWDEVKYAETNATGDYELANLDPGSYRVGFSSPSLVPEFWDDAGRVGLADTITVGPQSAVTGKNAVLAARSSISGVVTAAGGVPLAGIDVTLLEYDPFYGWEDLNEVSTATNGGYVFNRVPVGTFRLLFEDPDGNYAREYWDNGATLAAATDIVVRSSAPVTGRNAELAPAPPQAIRGTVTGPTGQPVVDVDVLLYVPDGDGGWIDRRSTRTGPAGTYRFPGLTAGSYRVGFQKVGYATEYHLNAASVDEATTLAVTSGDVVADAQLVTGTTISGAVTGPAGADAVGVAVTAYRRTAAGIWRFTSQRYVGQQGTYRLPNLAAGTYRLRFSDPDAEWPDEYWDDAATLASATDVVVTTTPVTGKNAVMGVGASIRGTVTTDGTTPLADVHVVPYLRVGTDYVALDSAATWTASNGSYDLDQLLPGTYRVGFDDAANQHAVEYWDNAATLASATDIPVTSGAIVTGRNAVLGNGGHITGTVTGAGGAPLAGLRVNALVFDNTEGGWTWHRSALTDGLGRYDVRGLAAGTYRLYADGFNYQPGYFGGTTLAEADDVVVATNATVSGRDLQLTPDGRLAGRVTDADGDPLDEVRVSLYQLHDGTDWGFIDSDSTDASGGYTLPGLGAGTYRLAFSDRSGFYLPEWFDGGATLAQATDVVLGAGAARTDLDVSLTRAGAEPAVRNRSLPVITGTPAVGSPLTSSTGTWSTSTGVSYARQWLSNGTEIPGAVGTTYTPVSGDVGKQISVRVTATRAGYTSGTATSAPTAAVGNLPPVTNTALPTVTGPAVVGGTLTAAPGSWNPSTGLAHAYQWLAEGADIPSATGTTYTPVPGDVGKRISVRVTTSRSGNTPGSATSAQTAAIVQQVVTNVTPPAITGTARVGSVLTASTGSWNPDTGLTFAYEWSANNVVIGGAAGSTYTPVAADEGKAIRVKVTASKQLHTPASATSAPTAAVVLPPLTNATPPAITGTPDVGSVLTATNGTWTPSDGLTFAYAWSVGGTPVGDTDNSYTPVAGDVGQTVTVTVTASRAGFSPTPATSAPTAAVRFPPLASTALPVISGTPQVGSELTASSGSWTPGDGLSFAYAWSVGGTAVGDTDNAYTPVAGDAGKTVTVTVTASRSGYRPTPATSAATTAVAGPPISNTALPTITGITKVGQRLTAQPGTWSSGGLTYAYQWLVNGTPATRRHRLDLRAPGLGAGTAGGGAGDGVRTGPDAGAGHLGPDRERDRGRAATDPSPDHHRHAPGGADAPRDRRHHVTGGDDGAVPVAAQRRRHPGRHPGDVPPGGGRPGQADHPPRHLQPGRLRRAQGDLAGHGGGPLGDRSPTEGPALRRRRVNSSQFGVKSGPAGAEHLGVGCVAPTPHPRDRQRPPTHDLRDPLPPPCPAPGPGGTPREPRAAPHRRRRRPDRHRRGHRRHLRRGERPGRPARGRPGHRLRPGPRASTAPG